MRSFSWKRAVGAPAAALLALGGAAFAVVGTGSPAGATTTVHDAAELQAAFNSDETVIILANDISVTTRILRDNTHNGDVVIEGAGFTITSDGSDRIFEDRGTGRLELQNITLTGGVIDSDGGAVAARGDVIVSNATFTDNHATDGYGGAIVSETNVTSDGSTFDNNTSYDSGGAIAAGEDVTVKNGSSFTGNAAESDGGAVYSEAGLVDISGSTFTNNQADANLGGYGDGGAAFSFNRMIVAGSTFSGNFTTSEQDAGGGAVEAIGTLDVSDSTFTGNAANLVGGALYGADDTTIARSTFTGNCAAYGGAIEHNIGPAPEGNDQPEEGTTALSIVNSTITANTQNSGDSAIGAFGATTEIAYSTIVGNINDDSSDCGLPALESGAAAAEHRSAKAGAAGTVHARAGFEDGVNLVVINDVTLFGNVIAGPVGGPNCFVEEGSNLTSQGYNFSDDSSCDLTNATDKVATPNDPQLNALGPWGGPTDTMLPFTPLHGGVTSPLIDAIPAAACQTGIATGVTTDQRGVTRPQLVGCDIGAVEVTGAEYQVEAAVVTPRFTG
ncbi:MAG: choice-of-anchor Q domain-containing protein [Acidimicrobiia bacterium]